MKTKIRNSSCLKLNEDYDPRDSRTSAPEENCPLTPKLTETQTLTLTRGQFFSGAVVWLPRNPKTNPNLDQNPNSN